MPRNVTNRLFQELPEPVCVVAAPSMTILEWNVRAADMFGLSLESRGKQKLTDCIQAWDTAKFLEAFTRQQFDSPELKGVTGLRSAGGPLHLDLSVCETVWRDQRVFLVVFADAGQRVRLEEQLRQAQKVESVGMLAGGIAHDFNNLLTIISGYSHMLTASLNSDQNNKSAAEQIIKASERAAALTKQLLSFSRRQVVQTKILDINAVVQGMAPMLMRLIGAPIQLNFAPGADLGRVRADAGQVEQVIMNLVVNARDAMPNGGTLRIETRNTELDSSYLSRHMEARPGRYVMLAVSDSGIGMDAATREQVFEPFFTTKVEGKGTGLGLSMVYGIVKRWGGTVDVYSEQGLGTAIKIYFPRAENAEVPASPDEESKPIRGTETVLLVEDDEAVRKITRAALEAQGYLVLVAASGEDGLATARAHPGPIDLLITDVVLPQMNGREVAKRLHKKRPNTVVLFTSGYTEITLNEMADPDKQVHFIGKPFSPASLANRVRELLDEKAGGTGRALKLGIPQNQGGPE